MKRVLSPALAIALLGAAHALAAAPAQGPTFQATLEARGAHEECARLEAGEKRKWFWKSDQPVDFNIHYHRGSEEFYPVKRPGMRGDGGTFHAKTAEDYCWMWVARDKPAKLKGRLGQ